jgi:DNA helicase-2/ATP-dependent DNA helicase PcrA
LHDLLSDLNESQRSAVTHGEGPLLIVAGPGSGKTRVVSRRVAWLIGEGVRPGEILAVTFTNKAAAELRERVGRLVPAGGLWVSTFHSACARILRDHHGALGYPSAFTIYDEEDRRRTAGRVLRELGVPADRVRPAALAKAVSAWKTAGIDPDGAAKAAWGPRDEELAKAYAHYERILHEAGSMDFDDLLVKTHRLLETDEAVLAEYRARLRWVLVDEYQDTNRIQFLLARALASGSRNLCATGDPDQSIYGWRGADIRNILDFEDHYPDATVVRLETNYRSTGHVLDAASRLIRRNLDRREKELLTEATAGEEVRVTVHDGADEEGEGVAAAVEELVTGGMRASDIAVLYRVNARSRAVELAFRRRGIPYQVLRGVEFFQRAEVKDLVAWLRLLGNPMDAEALARALQAPRRGAGSGTVAKILSAASSRGVPVREALLSGSGSLEVRGRAGKAVDLAAEAVRELLLGATDEVGPLLDRVLSVTGYRDWLERHWPEDHQERWDNVLELVEAARAHDGREEGGGLSSFLEEVALVSDQDRYDPDAPRVNLMTLHTCKGLEFPAVFVVGVEEGVLPHARSARGEWGEDAAGIEEERRLLFVGMTRAKRVLRLSAGLRAAGWTGGMEAGPSRFLQEIEGEGVLRVDRTSGGGLADDGPAPWSRRSGGSRGPSRSRRKREGDAPFSFDPDPAPPEAVARVEGLPFRVGQRVRHTKFGTGKVRRLEAHGNSVRATVEFRMGVKTLDLDFTRLEPLGDGS